MITHSLPAFIMNKISALEIDPPGPDCRYCGDQDLQCGHCLSYVQRARYRILDMNSSFVLTLGRNALLDLLGISEAVMECHMSIKFSGLDDDRSWNQECEHLAKIERVADGALGALNAV